MRGLLGISVVSSVVSMLAIVSAPLAGAQPPESVLIQGQLLDAQGVPIPGLRQYRVRFFNAQSEGSQLGANASGFTAIGPEGIFSFSLAPPAAALQAPELWYELAVDSTPIPNGVDNSDVFADRIRVHSVPFALVANQALRVEAEGIGTGMVSGAEFDALFGVSGNIQTQLDSKAAQVDVDNALGAKADVNAVYLKQEVDDALSVKADADDVYTRAEVDARVLNWEVVTTTPVQAVPNRGYLVNVPFTEGVITLPDNAALAVGDLVRVTGAGSGGWRIGLNDDQRIIMRSLGIPSYKDHWTSRDSNRAWRGVASSADGTRLAAVVNNGQIHMSSDSGATWSPKDSNRAWIAVASSSDGSRLVAAVFNGQLYTSSDFGESWIPRDSNRDWYRVASSSDGVRLAAVTLTGQIYTSDDLGENWTPRESNRQWRAIACSSDGLTLLAVGANVPPRISFDGGVSWVDRNTGVNLYSAAAMSADASVMVVSSSSANSVFVSLDGGTTWTQRPGLGAANGIAMSADGSTMVAASGFATSTIWVSVDAGASWQTRHVALDWKGIACSADGRKVVAVADAGRIHTTQAMRIVTQTSLGVSGRLTGGPHTAVELQYIGNGVLLPLSTAGSVGVQ